MKKLSRILVLQHATSEHPGIFRDYLQEDEIDWCPITLANEVQIPSLDNFDALWVMGGPMNVWEETQYPWLKQEKELIREAVIKRGMPYFGICLGHQLLSDALGGEVGISEHSEIGFFDIHKTPKGIENNFLYGFPNTFKCLQWHSAEVKVAPKDSIVLASSDACGIQAISMCEHAYSIQFHIEATLTTISEWCELPSLKAELELNLGDNAIKDLNIELDKYLDDINLNSRLLYENWKNLIN